MLCFILLICVVLSFKSPDSNINLWSGKRKSLLEFEITIETHINLDIIPIFEKNCNMCVFDDMEIISTKDDIYKIKYIDRQIELFLYDNILQKHENSFMCFLCITNELK